MLRRIRLECHRKRSPFRFSKVESLELEGRPPLGVHPDYDLPRVG